MAQKMLNMHSEGGKGLNAKKTIIVGSELKHLDLVRYFPHGRASSSCVFNGRASQQDA
jgi:hypothetical protein